MAREDNAVDLHRIPLILQAERNLVELVAGCADVVIDDYLLACDALGVL